MTDAEKIEALREWANKNDEPDFGQWAAGYLKALTEVRDLIDPPILCDCGQEDVRGSTVERAGVKHSETWCERCCPHGALVREVCEECNPPKPKWRQMVNEEAEKSLIVTPIGAVLYHLSHVANPSEYDAAFELANIVAVCEKRWVDDGWKADPDRVPVGHWGISWLLVPLSQEPPAWHVLGDRAAAWLRSLKDEKPGTRTDAKYEHTLEPHCPVCFGVCAGSNRDGAA